MFKKNTILLFAILLLSISASRAFAFDFHINDSKLATQTNAVYDLRPWSVTIYNGYMTKSTLGEVLAQDFSFHGGPLFSLDIGRELPPTFFLKRWLHFVFTSISVHGAVTYEDDPAGYILELNPYIAGYFTHFPWNKYLFTSLGVGEGVSYASHAPTGEARFIRNQRHFLNFLMFELAFALPKHRQWEVAIHVHHRSGAYGTYGVSHSGSTAIGLALRYRF